MRAERQRVRWADMEEGQTEEKEVIMESQEKFQEGGFRDKIREIDES